MFKVELLGTYPSCALNSCRLMLLIFFENCFYSYPSFQKRIPFLLHVGLFIMQSFFAGLAASGALTSALRLITKAAFEKSDNGLRKGVSM